MKAIYQLNKYNKAWLNTNSAKTPTSFTVESRNCLKYSEKRIASIHGNFFTFTCIHTRKHKRAVYTKRDLAWALSFPHHTLFVF